MKSLELLAPAKNLECGIAAIDHGADAVYIGAPRFGARAAAGNSVDDIAALCRYAHQYGAKVYVTTNTIIYDDELDDTFLLIKDLKQAGVDALLVQDMGLINPPPAPPEVRGAQKASPVGGGWRGLFHASTQTDNRTPEKVKWLWSLGFQRVVLARELSLEEIREIHRQVPDVELEVFVHGALCVSYSGQCYMSQYCLGRSANRGECAQMCRMKYDLLDADGCEIEHQRHLLSLKDLCRIDSLEELADAGAVSFKIEGRLKDVAYVKNVVAAYSQRLDALCARRPHDYERASKGRVTYGFKPDLSKSFNRGYTDYFLHCYRDEHGVLQGRQRDIISPDTPKALGEYVGKVKEIRRDSLTVAGTAAFANGDGLCFFRKPTPAPSQKGRENRGALELVGFRVNRAEGNRLFPLKMPEGLRPGMALYRNNDVAFERLMAGKTAERKISISMVFREVEDGFELVVKDYGSEKVQASVVLPMTEKPLAQKPQRENIIRQLAKLGNTPFVCEEVVIEGNADKYFIPSSQLAELRRKTLPPAPPGLSPSPSPEGRVALEGSGMPSQKGRVIAPLSLQEGHEERSYLLNVSNRLAREFYRRQGIEAEDAFELQSKREEALLMQCRHCLRYTLGYCVKHGGMKPTWREPLTLRLGDGREFRLEFDCRQCQMNIYSKWQGDKVTK